MLPSKRVILSLGLLALPIIWLISSLKNTEEIIISINEQNEQYFYNVSEEKNFILFDLGCNNGDSLLSFFGFKPRYPQFIEERLTYRSFGKIAQNATWTIYAFEANAKFNKDLDKVIRIFKHSTKHKIDIFKETAAWKYDGTVDFYAENVTGFGLGSSIESTHPDVVKSGAAKHPVACKDIGKMLKETHRKDNYVVMKIDIEGSEYELILDLIKKDALRFVDHFAVEFHGNLKKFKTPEKVFFSLLKLYGASASEWI